VNRHATNPGTSAVAGCGDDLRHTHERRRAGAGLGLPIIGKLLGHAQASTTARARCRHGRHLRGWTYYFASRRTVFKQLEQSAGVLASKLSSDRFVRDQ
jgi:integrase